jgi:hypothetical protein
LGDSVAYTIPEAEDAKRPIDWFSIPLADLGARASEWVVRKLMQELTSTNSLENPDYWEAVRSLAQYLKQLPRRSAGWTEEHERIVLDVLAEEAPEVRKKVLERLKAYEQSLEENV